MEKIQDVEKAINLNQELLAETKKRLTETAAKLTDAKGGTKRIEAEIKDLKEKRQAALARGGDAKGLNDSLKKLESEFELETETVTGLEVFIQELRAEESGLHVTINELPKRILQLRSLELAASYNSLAEQMAPIVEGLNKIYYKLTGNGNNKESLVVFYPLEGAFEKLPKIFFDPDGCGLETFVSRHPGFYYSNIMLAESEKCFYNWSSHQNKLRNG